MFAFTNSSLSKFLFAHILQLEQLAAASPKEFLIRCVDMMDSRSVSARSRAMVALCNFLSKSKDGINLDGLSVLLPKLLNFLPADKLHVMDEAETYLAGARVMFGCRFPFHCHRRRHSWDNMQPQQQRQDPQAMLRHGIFRQSG